MEFHRGTTWDCSCCTDEQPCCPLGHTPVRNPAMIFLPFLLDFSCQLTWSSFASPLHLPVYSRLFRHFILHYLKTCGRSFHSSIHSQRNCFTFQGICNFLGLSEVGYEKIVFILHSFFTLLIHFSFWLENIWFWAMGQNLGSKHQLIA